MTASLTFNPFQQKFRSNVLILGTIKQLQLKNNVNLEKVQVLNSLSAPLFKNNFLNSFQQQHGDSLITLAKLKAEKTRNGYLMRTDLVKEILEKFAPASLTELDIIFLLDSEVQALTAVQAICTHFSLYDRTTSPKDAAKSVNVSFITLDESVVDYEKLRVLSQGIRLAARLTDMPASELNTQTYVEEVNAVYKDLVSKGFKNLNLEVIKGEELKAKGLGGIYGVGKAAEFPPALAILSFKPENAKRTMAWVGKGIVYDTGGLSIKVPPNM
ncbi:putative aminopeptidase npepl1 [Clydaea vesicula]|uniref:Aminopeptidase npepl1 n=1 Tax=Clydaea vesicula TaxID=447962 RepID=A0AAD5U642_9FUNG|nr:putative aminopeptidase npepl1 [Clydaea vesicula]